MRLIDADELNERFESSCTTECACCPYSDDNCGLVHEADTVNAIVIPKNATNGDVLGMIFPEIAKAKKQLEDANNKELDVIPIQFNKAWWNTPYKELNNEK
jgi:hypothetical protein